MDLPLTKDERALAREPSHPVCLSPAHSSFALLSLFKRRDDAQWATEHKFRFNKSSTKMKAFMSIMPALCTITTVLRPRTSFAYILPSSASRSCSSRLFGSSSTATTVESSISRLDTLQQLLSKHGAPGSRHCNRPNDLIPINTSNSSPELVSALTGDNSLADLHPYLYPICQSQANPESYVCAYRNPHVEQTELQQQQQQQQAVWPIVETHRSGRGLQVLALHSEHLMRRIACECDNGTHPELVDLYNDGLGNNKKYEPGSVEQLGYGVDKYVLLRAGPFPDLYQKMARQHLQKGDEQSALISAEACNSKLAGFGSNFAFYASLLAECPQRDEESRDAARMCLRLPLATAGLMLREELAAVASLGLMGDANEPLQNVKTMFEAIRKAESEEDPREAGKSLEQVAIDEANIMLDMAVLDGTPWSSVRASVSEQLRIAGLADMANFVDQQKGN